MNVHDTHSACDDCTLILANGDCGENTEEHSHSMVSHCHDRGIDLGGASVGDETGYSTHPCQMCGSRLHGNRHSVVVLCNHAECAA